MSKLEARDRAQLVVTPTNPAWSRALIGRFLRLDSEHDLLDQPP
jgi:hypothetical protein